MNLRLAFAVTTLLLFPAAAYPAAAILPVYLDDQDTGFFDNSNPDSNSMADGNPGTTLGEQRRWAFEKALEYWAFRLDSNVTIQVIAEMSDLPCDEFSAVLDSAGAETVHANWSAGAGGDPPAFDDTWYGQALANRISNKDNSAGNEDIGSIFNQDIDASDECLGSNTWYYALGAAPFGQVSFFKTAVHEIGHGINVQTFVDVTDGTRLSTSPPNPQELDDVYMKFLEDLQIGKTWPNMSDGERADSATNTDDLVWFGASVQTASGDLASGTVGDKVKMYAPDPLEEGSSVSHWNTDVDDMSGGREIMQPSATGSEKLLVTHAMLEDMGWNEILPSNCTFDLDHRNVTGTQNGNNTFNACATVTYDGTVINSGTTSTIAGQLVTMAAGFNVKSGATFAATTDPTIGL